MATGYTHDVADGKITELKPFALRLARGMGYCIDQREEDMDSPPRKRTPAKHHEESLAESRRQLVELDEMTAEQIKTRCEAEHARACKSYKEIRIEHAEKAKRYNSMLIKVENWEPPSPEHAGLKKFMLEQLRDSLDHDTGSKYFDKDPEPQEPGEWYESQLEMARERITRDEKSVVDEIAYCKKQNAWIDALYASLA